MAKVQKLTKMIEANGMNGQWIVNEQATTFIRSTGDYSVFNRVEGNRIVDPAHVAKLTASIREKNMLHLFPIVVNKKMEVIDGQHRLQAATNLGVPISYIISDGAITSSDVKQINVTQKAWNQHDYLAHYCELGNTEYLTLKSFYNQNKDILTLGRAVNLIMYGDRKNHNRAFKDGKIICNDVAYADKCCRIMRDFIPYFYNGRSVKPEVRFLYAVQNIAGNVNYDHGRMLDRLSKYTRPFRLFGVSKDQVEVGFDDIYNFRITEANRVRLLWLLAGNRDWRPERKKFEASLKKGE